MGDVVDASHENALEQRRTVLETLKEIGEGEIPVLTAFNKIDLMDDAELMKLHMHGDPQATYVSAATGEGLEPLMTAIGQELFARYEKLIVLLPFDQGQLG